MTAATGVDQLHEWNATTVAGLPRRNKGERFAAGLLEDFAFVHGLPLPVWRCWVDRGDGGGVYGVQMATTDDVQLWAETLGVPCSISQRNRSLYRTHLTTITIPRFVIWSGGEVTLHLVHARIGAAS